MEDIDELIEEYQESLGRVVARRTEIRARLPEKEPWKGDPALWKRYMYLCRMEGDTRYALCQMLRSKEGNVKI